MIEAIYSNVKGRIDLQFASPYNLIFGRNGSGKSSIIHSIELGAFDTAFDAAGKDVRSKADLKFLAPRGRELFCHLTVDGEEVDWGDRSDRFDNVVATAMRALTGGHTALIEFLLKHIDDDDHPIAIQAQGWEARVKHHGSYRKALLEMMKSTSTSLRGHQKRHRELGVILEYIEDNGLEPYFVENEWKSLNSQIAELKTLKAQIDAEALIFIKGSFDAVEDGINRCLPEEIGRAQFIETGNKIRLSINGDAVIPSGVETVALAVALAGALLSGPRALFILPDRAYDPRTLGWLMRSLRNVACAGVFVQTTVLPEGYDFMSLGWDLVSV
jgi:hypothetical protein